MAEDRNTCLNQGWVAFLGWGLQGHGEYQVEEDPFTNKTAVPSLLPGILTAPKPKRRRLEAVKRLDFGQLNRIASEDSPQDSSAPTLSPNDLSEYLDARLAHQD